MQTIENRLDINTYFLVDIDSFKKIGFDEYIIHEKRLKDKLDKIEGQAYAKYFTSITREDGEDPIHNLGLIDSFGKKYSLMVPENILSKMFEYNLIKEIKEESKIAYLLLLGIDTSFKGE